MGAIKNIAFRQSQSAIGLQQLGSRPNFKGDDGPIYSATEGTLDRDECWIDALLDNGKPRRGAAGSLMHFNALGEACSRVVRFVPMSNSSEGHGAVG